MVQKSRKLMKSTTLFSMTFLVAVLLCGVEGILAEWPEKQVDFVNPWGAGGAADVQARKLAEISYRISKRLDCGIAMLHIEISAMKHGIKGTWEFLRPPEVARWRIAEAT